MRLSNLWPLPVVSLFLVLAWSCNGTNEVPTGGLGPVTPYPTPTPFAVRNIATGSSGPRAVAVEKSQDRVLVADTGNNQVLEFDAYGNSILGWGGTGAVAFTDPQAVAKDKDGNVYVTGPSVNYVQKFNAMGTPLGQITTANGTALSAPRGLYLDHNDHLYISDTGNQRVVVLDKTGASVTQWGGGSGAFSTAPHSLAGLSADSMGRTVAGASPADNAVYLYSYGGGVVAITGLNAPQDAVLDRQGDVFIANTGGNNILRYDPMGATLLQTIALGFSGPRGLDLTVVDDLFVADTGNNRVVFIRTAE